MAATTSFQVTGLRRAERERLEQAVAQAFSSVPGRWRVQFLGSTAEDVWEMCISGPAVETSEYIDRTLGQHEPDHIIPVLQRVATE